MIVNTQTLTLSQAAYRLMKDLGGLRNWTNFLTDNIRGKQNIAGHQLLPCGRQHDSKSFRPIYALDDVLDFIDKVKVAVPSSGKSPTETTVLPIDTGKHWRINKFRMDGSPVALLSSYIAKWRGHCLPYRLQKVTQ